MKDHDLAEKIYKYLPDFLEEGDDSTMLKFLAAHGEEVEEFEDELNGVRFSRQVEHAEGNELDELGRLFGTIGRRRGRDDDEYRKYIKSIVPVFSGRGTHESVRRAISAALSMPMEDFTIEENTTTVSYAIYVHDWTNHDLQGLREIAQIADPSGVELTDVIYGPIDNKTIVTDTVTYDAGEVFEEPPVLSTDTVSEGDKYSFTEASLTGDTINVHELEAAWDVSDWGTMIWV